MNDAVPPPAATPNEPDDPRDRRRPPVACCALAAAGLALVTLSLGYVASQALGIAVIQRTMSTPRSVTMSDERTLIWSDPANGICVSGQWGFFSQPRTNTATVEAFSEDGTRAIADVGGQIEVSVIAPNNYRIDAEAAWKPTRKFPSPTAVAISNDGEAVLLGTGSGVGVWRGTGPGFRKLAGTFEEAPSPSALAIHKSKRTALAVSAKSVVVFDLDRLEKVWQVDGGAIREALFVPADDRVVVRSDTEVAVHAPGKPKLVIAAPAWPVVAVAADGRFVAICRNDEVLVRDTRLGRPVHHSRLPGSRQITCATFSPEGAYLYVGTVGCELIRTTYRGNR